MAKTLANSPIVVPKNYDIADKTIHYILVNRVTEKPILKNAEADESLKKADFNLMFDLKTLIHTTWVYLKLLHLKICVRKKLKERAPEKFSPVFNEITKRFGLKFAGDKSVIPEERKKEVVDALHLGQPSSKKRLPRSNIFWWSGMKDNESKCSICTTCMSSGRNLKYQLPSTEKIKLPVLTEPGQEIQLDFPGKPHKKM